MQRSKKLHWCCVRLPGDEQKRCSYETDYGKTSIFQNPKCQSSTWFHFIMHSCRNAHFWRFLKMANLATCERGAARQSFHFQKFTWTVKMCFFVNAFLWLQRENRQKENLKQNFFCTVLQYDLPPLRPHCGEAPGLDSNPRGTSDLEERTLITSPPHLLNICCRQPKWAKNEICSWHGQKQNIFFYFSSFLAFKKIE